MALKMSQTILKLCAKLVFGDKTNIIDEPSFLNHLIVVHALDQHTLFSSLSTNKTTLFNFLPPLSRLILDFNFLSLCFHLYTIPFLSFSLDDGNYDDDDDTDEI